LPSIEKHSTTTLFVGNIPKAKTWSRTMLDNRNSSSVISDSSIDAIGILHQATRVICDLEERLSAAIRPHDLDPFLRNEMECVTRAITATMVSLSLATMSVNEVLKEVANGAPSNRRPSGGVKGTEKSFSNGHKGLDLAKDVFRRRYPALPEIKINRLAEDLVRRIENEIAGEGVRCPVC
jgi:hypothetical protein